MNANVHSEQNNDKARAEYNVVSNFQTNPTRIDYTILKVSRYFRSLFIQLNEYDDY